MPAPAVIPAPRAYIKVAAVKTPVAVSVIVSWRFDLSGSVDLPLSYYYGGPPGLS